jgi:hypothetical protein
MKRINILFAIIFVVACTFCFTGVSEAFHDGGVAYCEGCHTMHNSMDGKAVTTNLPQYQAGPYLLKASDQSSTCLNCHQKAGLTGPSSYHISTAESDMPTGVPPIQMTPGGDFGWLKKTYNWVGTDTGPQTSKGERHGHNIIALDYGYQADTTITEAPGGDAFQYPANQLSCISCHDPHGKYRRTSSGAITTGGLPIIASGSYVDSPNPDATHAVGAYRLLAGLNYQPASLSGSYAFGIGTSFIAVAPDDYNRSEASTDVRIAYGKNVSLWCANCHTLMHSTYGSVIHPVDQQLASTIAGNYNKYVKTGDLSGTVSTSYLSLVPFQMDNTTNVTGTLKPAVTSTAGPLSTDRVMCLTCHRAHASAWDSIMRFPVTTTFMTVADGSGNAIYPDPGTNPDEAMGRATVEFQRGLYDRPATKFAPFQRVLCNKCHVKD